MTEGHTVDVQLAHGAPRGLSEGLIADLVRFGLDAEGVSEPVSVGVVVTDDATIEGLHARSMGIAEPTDVLSFALEEGERFPDIDESRLLGDIVVSYETAARQAGDAGNTPEREVAFLVLHGLLHLLGYDDREPAERERMLTRQEAILVAHERAGNGR